MQGDRIVEALKAVRDKQTCLDGLQALRALLRDPGRQAAADALLARMPDAAELRAVWDMQLLMKDSRVAAELLAVVAELLGHPAYQQQAPRSPDVSPAERLAAGITAHRLRSLGHCLGSGNVPVAAAALRLLTAVAALGPGPAADLAQAFDFSLPAFGKAALPPRRAGAEGEQPAAAAAATAEAWAKQAPVCTAFADFCLQLLQGADAALLSRLLRTRQLWDGLLCHLGRQPAWQQRRILAAVQAALRCEAASRLPPAVRAEPFSDAAVAQLARVAQEAGDSPEAGAAAAAALELLTALGTEPALGLCPPAGEEGGPAQAAAGRRSLLRLLQRLRALESPPHFRLLVAVGQQTPALAAAALGGLQLPGEPRLGGGWLAGLAAVGRLVPAAARLPSPLQRGAGAPPALDASSVRALLRRTLPPALSKAQLTRACQSPQPLLRFAACCTLRVLLDAAAAALRDAAAAAAAAASPEARTAWREFSRGFASALRARLPDVASLRKVLAELQPGLAQVSGGARLSQAQLCAVPLLAALETYQAWLPEAAAEAGLGAGRLLTREVERWPPVLQTSLLRLLARAAASPADSARDAAAAAPPPPPPASLQSTDALETLLALAARGGAGVARAAKSVAAAAIASAVGCPPRSPELWLWLARLPGPGQASTEALTAAAKFLAEAVVAVARRPQELWELVLEPVTDATVTASSVAVTAPAAVTEPARFSLLAVAALSRALKVLKSEKMAVGSQAAIAAYVAGVLTATLQTQRQPARLARTLQRVLAAAAQAQAAEPAAEAAAEAAADSPRKRKRHKCSPLSLPAAGRAIAALAQFAHQVLGAALADAQSGRKKRRTSGQGSTPGAAAEAAGATAVVLQPPAAEAEQLVGRLRAWLQGSGQGWAPGELAAALLCCSEPELRAGLPTLLQRGQAQALLLAAQCDGQLAATALSAEGSAAVWVACDAAALVCAACSCQGGLLERRELRQRLLQRLRGAEAPEREAACAALLFWAQQQQQQQQQGAALGLLERLLQDLTPSELAALRSELLPHPLLLHSFLAAPASEQQQAAGRLAGLLLRSPGGSTAAEAAPYMHRLAGALAAALQAGSAAEAGAGALLQLAALLPLLPPAALQGLLPAADRCAERLLRQSEGSSAAAEALLPPLALALARQQQQCSPQLAAAAARLARTSAAARAALAAAAETLPAGFWRAMGGEAQPLLQACLGGSGLTADGSRLAAALVAAVLPCRLAFEPALVQLLARAAELGTQERREATALLLPPAAAFLQQPPPAQGRALAAALRERLLAFVASGSGAASSQGAQLSPPAEAALRSRALPVLLRCLRLAPLPREQQARAERRLLPAAGWPWRGGAAAAAAAARAAALAAHVVQHRPEGAPAELLARYAAACMATLAQLTGRSSKQAPEEAALAAQLWAALDGWVGDSLAEQPQARSGPLAALLAGGLLPLGTAVLQHSLGSAATVRSLRRLAAALLPAAEAEPEAEARAELLPDAGDRSPALAAAAARLLTLLTSHARFASLISPQQGAAGAAAAAAAAAASAGEFASLLPAVEARQAVQPQAPQARTELLELLEILLDLLRQHSPPGSLAQQQQQQQQQIQSLAALPARLLPCYAASLEPGDLAIFRILRLLGRLLQPGGGGGPAAALAGPLAATDFLWGEAAAAAAADASGRQRQRLLACPDWVQLGRVAATVAHFPEGRTLAGQEADPGSAAPHAAHDPAFLLLFCVHALRQPQLRLDAFAQSGLLPLCLRCLAAADPPLRALAFEAAALCSARLQADASGSFRGKSQLAALLGLAQRSVPQPFARLPALAAAFLAEAALVLLQPGSPLYPPLCKLLAGSKALSLQEVPLMGKLLGSCSSDSQAAERTWLLQLLLAGARGELDAGICRKRFVGELLMSLHDSPLAGPHLQQLAAAFLCGRLRRLPGYAADLAARAGLVPWLAATACAAIAGGSSIGGSGGGGRGRQADAALQAIGALQALLQPAEPPDESPLPEEPAMGGAAAAAQLRSFGPPLSALCSAAAEAPAQPAVSAALTRLLAAFLQASAAAEPQPQGWQPLQALPPAPSPQQLQQHLSAAATEQGRLPADALGCLLAVDLRRSAEGPLLLQASALAQWLQRRQLPPAASPANPAAVAGLLAWLGAAAEAGAALASDADGAAERQAAALRVLAAYDSLPPPLQGECARAAAVALLHLLQPCVAAACGLPAAGSQEPSGEGAGSLQGSSAEWVWLLGNTLPRLLDCAGLPRLGPAGSSWPAGGLRAGAGPAGSPQAQAAAAELLLLLLAQWLARCDASLVWRTLLLWQGGAAGPELAAIGRREARQAGKAGLEIGA